MTIQITAAVAALAFGMAVAGAADARTTCAGAAKADKTVQNKTTKNKRAHDRIPGFTSTTINGVNVIKPEVVTYYSDKPAAPAPTAAPAYAALYPPPGADYEDADNYVPWSYWGDGYLPLFYGFDGDGFRRHGSGFHHRFGDSHGFDGRVVPRSRFMRGNTFSPRPAFASETFNSRGFRGGFHSGGLVARGAVGGFHSTMGGRGR